LSATGPHNGASADAATHSSILNLMKKPLEDGICISVQIRREGVEPRGG